MCGIHQGALNRFYLLTIMTKVAIYMSSQIFLQVLACFLYLCEGKWLDSDLIS